MLLKLMALCGNIYNGAIYITGAGRGHAGLECDVRCAHDAGVQVPPLCPQLIIIIVYIPPFETTFSVLWGSFSCQVRCSIQIP